MHFDTRIWFPSKKGEIKSYILNSENVVTHNYFPFLKVIKETKRIRFSKKAYRRVITPKERPISYAAHLDSLIFSFYSSYLSERYEELLPTLGISDAVIAYRSLDKCNIDFAKDVFKTITRNGECVAIALDIKGFFDSLSHEKLKQKWLQIYNGIEGSALKLPPDQFSVFKAITKYSSIELDSVVTKLGLRDEQLKNGTLNRFCSIQDFRTKLRKSIVVNKDLGIPQGSPISAILSNIYMIDFDIAMTALSKEKEFLYRRYCDDVIVVCALPDYDEVTKFLNERILQLDLVIQEDKTSEVWFRNSEKTELRGYENTSSSKFKNLQYLGFDFDGTRTYLRSSSLSRYYFRMKKAVRETVKKAYGKNAVGNRIFRKKLRERCTHLGEKNFLSYSYRADKIMASPEIRKQVSRHTTILSETIKSRNLKHINKMLRKGKIFEKKE